MRLSGLVTVVLLAMPTFLLAQDSDQTRAEVRRALNAVFETVENADIQGFVALHDEDATLYHYMGPSGTVPRRLQGLADIERSMGVVFEQIKAGSGRTTGPYVDIQPVDLLIQDFDQFAVVSFHLGGTTHSRRTLVFRSVAAAWKVVHIHGSLLQPAIQN